AHDRSADGTARHGFIHDSGRGCDGHAVCRRDAGLACHIDSSLLCAVCLLRNQAQGVPVAENHLLSQPMGRSREHRFSDHPVVACFRNGRDNRSGAWRRQTETFLPARGSHRLHSLRYRRRARFHRYGHGRGNVLSAGAQEHKGCRVCRGQFRTVSCARNRGTDRRTGIRQYCGGHGTSPDKRAGPAIHQLRRKLSNTESFLDRDSPEYFKQDEGGSMRLLIAGGGTGGHLFPGIAVAEEFLTRDPANEVLFVGTERGVEARLLPKLGYRLELIAAAGVRGKSFIGQLKGLAGFLYGYSQSRRILKGFKPDLVLGVGGYASAPLVLAARGLLIPRFVHEQNAIPGMTNKLLSRIAVKAFISLEESRKFFPKDTTLLTGNPLR